jgi:hypothetical protein
MRILRWWKGGLGVATLSFVIGSVRLVGTGATDWLTSVWFLVAGLYAFAAVVVRRLGLPERAEDWLGPLERRSRLATLLERSPSVGSAARVRRDLDEAPRIGYLQLGSDEVVTRNRIANALAVAAAVVGLVLVFSGAGQKSDDDTPATAPTSSHVAPGQSAPPAPTTKVDEN